MQSHILSWGRSLIERGAWYFAPFSWIFALLIFLRNFLYDKGFFVSHSVSCPVVSIGNVVAGGTGKTPFVLSLAEKFAHKKVAILSRGYGKIPDEALLLKRRLSHAKVYIGKDRVFLANQAVKEGAELIILDDGFQYRKLRRDFEIILLSNHDPFGKGRFLPFGFLRDDPKRMRKADVLFVKDRDFHLTLRRITNEKGDIFPTLQGWKVGIFSGIAHPTSFKKIVTSSGATIVSEWSLADHALASANRLNRFAKVCKALEASALVTTEKDFVKGPKTLLPILCLEVGIEWMQGQKKWENLIAKIERKLDNKHI